MDDLDTPLKRGDVVVYEGRFFFYRPNGSKACYLFDKLEDIGLTGLRVYAPSPNSVRKATREELRCNGVLPPRRLFEVDPANAQREAWMWREEEARLQAAREEQARRQAAQEEETRLQVAREEQARRQAAQEQEVWQRAAQEEQARRHSLATRAWSSSEQVAPALAPASSVKSTKKLGTVEPGKEEGDTQEDERVLAVGRSGAEGNVVGARKKNNAPGPKNTTHNERPLTLEMFLERQVAKALRPKKASEVSGGNGSFTSLICSSRKRLVSGLAGTLWGKWKLRT
jgi:pyruvate/2-oxoglutarate dehydrogenase complex dihydrolipoamide acyltransferase (E2) component